MGRCHGPESQLRLRKVHRSCHGVAFAIRRQFGEQQEQGTEYLTLQTRVGVLQRQIEIAETDRAARLQVIEEQGRRLGETEAERNNLRYQLADLQQHFEITESDRAARLKSSKYREVGWEKWRPSATMRGQS